MSLAYWWNWWALITAMNLLFMTYTANLWVSSINDKQQGSEDPALPHPILDQLIHIDWQPPYWKHRCLPRFTAERHQQRHMAFDRSIMDSSVSTDSYYQIVESVQQLFQSYLSNQLQHVRVGSSSSSPCYMVCGVPEGSVLGAILFLLYCGDLQLIV